MAWMASSTHDQSRVEMQVAVAAVVVEHSDAAARQVLACLGCSDAGAAAVQCRDILQHAALCVRCGACNTS
jgi:hypothetical protein